MKRKRKYRKPETVKTGNAVVKIYRRDKRHKIKDGDKVLRVEKYRVWEVEDRSNGTRVLRSFSDHGKALAEAKRIADKGSSANAAAKEMTNAQAASYACSVGNLDGTGLNLEMATSIIAKLVKILGNSDDIIPAAEFYKLHAAAKLTHKTVAEAVIELLEVKGKRTKKGRPASERYKGDLSARLERFSKDFAVDISTITHADVQGWIDRLKGSPQTAKNYRTVIGTLFSFAEARGYIIAGANPMAKVENIQANGGAIEIYTPEEFGKLLAGAPENFLPFVLLGAFAGLRSAEIERLEWSDIQDGHITVSADNAKTASRRLVPILPNLALWLANYANAKGKVWKGDSNDLQDARAETVKKSGIAWKDNGLRHSFISYRLADVQSAAQVSLEAGNTAKVVFKHYRELVKPEAAKAWFAIAPKQEAANA